MEEFIKNGLNMAQMEYVVQLFNPSMDDYLYVYDLKEDYYRISSHATERFFMETDHFFDAEKEHMRFVYEEDVPLLAEELRQVKSGTLLFHNLHYRWLDKQGKPIWINCRGKVLKDESGEPAFLIGCINEIGKRQKADNATGLLGETSLSIDVKQYEGKLPKGFFLRLGVDDFKDINGGLGIECGDFILKWLADCISENIEPGQKAYRLFSDEFMVVDFNGGNRDKAIRFYKSVRKSIDSFIEENGYQSIFTISGGILSTEGIDGEYESVMKLSEFTLGEAKARGRGDAGDYSLKGAESLMRFTLPSGERVSPAEFIPLLEETGLIIPAGKWLLRHAFSLCAKWQKYIPDFRVNVNLSYVQVMKSQVLKEIMAAIEESSIAPETVGIELTESGYLDSSPHFRKLWSGLKKNGVQIILDDFGTGYSNLHCLGDLEPTYIKIDRSFTAKALNNQYERNLMVQIIEMSHSLGLGICIEGIETKEELAIMERLAPDYIQGYLFGKPNEENDFEQKFILTDSAASGIPVGSAQNAF